MVACTWLWLAVASGCRMRFESLSDNLEPRPDAALCTDCPAFTEWRVRNGDVSSSGQWQFRELAFCTDAECTQRQTDGMAIDSGNSRDWALPEFAFDGDPGTFWKTFDTDAVGQSFLGMSFGVHTEVHGIYLQTDNAVYSVATILVEAYDANVAEWVTVETLMDVPAGSELIYSVGSP